MSHHARKPDGAHRGEEDERPGLLLGSASVASPVSVPAKQPQRQPFYCKTKQEGREDDRAEETGDEDEEDEIGQSEEEHPWPDVENHRGQLRIWI